MLRVKIAIIDRGAVTGSDSDERLEPQKDALELSLKLACRV